MTARARQALALLMLTISITSPLSPALASSATAAIDGRVFDAALTHPLAGIIVSATSQGAKEPLASVVTDTKGRFRFKGLPGGDYMLLLIDRGGVPLAAAAIKAPAGAERSVLLGLPAALSKGKQSTDTAASAGGKKALAAWFSSPVGATIVLVASAVVIAVAADELLTKNDEEPLVASPSTP
ncbi:MAG: carboxypeptidase regulatory-like domain-containing protein [Acidobacteriota bacterium]